MGPGQAGPLQVTVGTLVSQQGSDMKKDMTGCSVGINGGSKKSRDTGKGRQWWWPGHGEKWLISPILKTEPTGLLTELT